MWANVTTSRHVVNSFRIESDESYVDGGTVRPVTRVKPPVSAWIVRERKRLGLTPRDLAVRLSAMGLPTAEGTPRTWEAGRSPSPDNIDGLEKIFGSHSPEAEAIGDTAYLARIDSLVERVGQLIEQNRQLIAALVPTPHPAEAASIPALQEAEQLSAQELARSTSQPRKSGRGDRGGAGPRALREAGSE